MALQQLIILRDRRELIISLDKVHYVTRGSKVSLRKIGPETTKYQETYIRIKLEDPRVLVELIVTAAQIYQRTLSHRDWPVSLSRPALPRSTTCTRCAYVCIVHTVHCNTHTVLHAAYGRATNSL